MLAISSSSPGYETGTDLTLFWHCKITDVHHQLPDIESLVWLCSHRHFRGSPRKEEGTLNHKVKWEQRPMKRHLLSEYYGEGLFCVLSSSYVSIKNVWKKSKGTVILYFDEVISCNKSVPLFRCIIQRGRIFATVGS